MSLNKDTLDKIYNVLVATKLSVAYGLNINPKTPLGSVSFGPDVDINLDSISLALFTTTSDLCDINAKDPALDITNHRKSYTVVVGERLRRHDVSKRIIRIFQDVVGVNLRSLWSLDPVDALGFYQTLQQEGLIKNLTWVTSRTPEDTSYVRVFENVPSFEIVQDKFEKQYKGRSWKKQDFFVKDKEGPRALDWVANSWSAQTLAYVLENPDHITIEKRSLMEALPPSSYVFSSSRSLDLSAFCLSSAAREGKITNVNRSDKGRRRRMLNAARQSFNADRPKVMTAILGKDMSHAWGVTDQIYYHGNHEGPCIRTTDLAWRWAPTKENDTRSNFDGCLSAAAHNMATAEKTLIQMTILQDLYDKHGGGSKFLDWVANTLVDKVLEDLPTFMNDSIYSDLITTIMKDGA